MNHRNAESNGEARFSIVYDGEALSDGTIDTRDLAPALLALADLFDEVRGVVPDAPSELSLRVRAQFERGSFEVYLELTKLYQQIVSIFSGQDASAWSNFFQILGISGAFGLFQLIKRARNRKPTSVTIERTEKVKITFEGDAPLEVDKTVWALFSNLRVRKAVERITEPLRGKGIDDFKIRFKGKDAIEVTRDEARYFVAPTEHEGEVVGTTTTRLMIVAPSFQMGNKWRVSDGNRVIFVSIADPSFTRAVQTGAEAFRKGDILQAELQTRQWIEGNELKAEYCITKVLDHHHAAVQEPLPLSDRSDEKDE